MGFNGSIGGGDGLGAERDEGGLRNSSSRQLRSGTAKLRWGMSPVRHVEGLGAFYRASEGAEQSGCEGEWWPSVGFNGATVLGGEGNGEGKRGVGEVKGRWRRFTLPRVGRGAVLGKVSRRQRRSAGRRLPGLRPEEGEEGAGRVGPKGQVGRHENKNNRNKGNLPGPQGNLGRNGKRVAGFSFPN
jgi:hypothetical protein